MADNGVVLYGCRLMVVSEMDPTTGEKKDEGKVVVFETPQSANISNQWIDGQRQELRGGDRLVATIEEQDELAGVQVQFTNAEMPGDALALLGGGTYEGTKYTPPRVGEVVPPVIVELFVARYGQGSQSEGSILGYRKWTFYHAKGRVPDYNAQGRNFMTPQFSINCTENQKADEPIYDFEDVANLPELD